MRDLFAFDKQLQTEKVREWTLVMLNGRRRLKRKTNDAGSEQSNRGLNTDRRERYENKAREREREREI
jgi:hypothetical protein